MNTIVHNGDKYVAEHIPGKGMCFVPEFKDNLERLTANSHIFGEDDGGNEREYIVVSDNETIWVLMIFIMGGRDQGNTVKQSDDPFSSPIVSKSKEEFISALRKRTDRKFRIQ